MRGQERGEEKSGPADAPIGVGVKCVCFGGGGGAGQNWAACRLPGVRGSMRGPTATSTALTAEWCLMATTINLLITVRLEAFRAARRDTCGGAGEGTGLD
jgi:hypothetical protein